MMVRDRRLLALSLAMLALAGGLGAVAWHDAEVLPDQLEEGGEVRVKGAAAPDHANHVADVANILGAYTVRLTSEPWPVLVTGYEPIPTTGVWIVEGQIIMTPDQNDEGVLVIEARSFQRPLLWK